MMKKEFEDLIQSELSNASWTTIQHVYQWHPRFELDGKNKAAQLWKLFGTSIFKELTKTADEAMELRQAVETLRAQLTTAHRALSEFNDEWK